MRFFKSFKLLHRRTKSDSSVPTPVTATVVPPRSQSLDEQVLIGEHFETTKAAVSIVSSTSSSIDIGIAQDRIQALETEVEDLKAAKRTIESQFTDLQDDAVVLRGDYYGGQQTGARQRREAKVAAGDMETLEKRLAQYDRFLGLITDIGLQEPVLSETQAAVRVGGDPDKSLVNTIKAAAAKPNSPWKRIIPPVTGPRTPENYLSAISMTVKAQEELKEAQKMVHFWKHFVLANEKPESTTITSSPIPSIPDEITGEPQTAVDDLLAQLYRGERPSRHRVETKEEPAVPEPEPMTALDASAASEPKSSITATGRSEFASNSASASTTRGPYIPNLAQLASISFKEELSTTYSASSLRRLSKRSSSQRLSKMNILGDINVNIQASASTTSQGSMKSAKAARKHMGVIVTGSIQSVQASIASAGQELSSKSVSTIAPPFSTSSLRTIPSEETIGNSHRNSNDSTGSAPFDNSAFESLIDGHSAPEQTTALEQIHEELGIENNNLSVDNEVSSGDTTEGPSDLPTNFSWAAETASSGNSTVPPSPVKTPARVHTPDAVPSPTKPSKLPVLKNIKRRLSASKPTIVAAINIMKPTPALVINKKNSASRPYHGKPITTPSTKPSKIPSPTKVTFPSKTPSLPPNSKRTSVPAPSRLPQPSQSRIASSGKKAIRRLSQIMT